MKGKFIGLSIIFMMVFSMVLVVPMSSADIAPIQFVEGGNLVIFVENSEVILQSYDIDVEVSAPRVYEILSYCLYNPSNITFNETLMIPFNFEHYSNDADLYIPISPDYPIDTDNPIMAAELIIDNETRLVRSDDIVTAQYMGNYFEGVYMDLIIMNNSYTNITLNCLKIFESSGDSVEKYTYFYTAETAEFWNGTVHHGTFQLSYNGEWNHTNFTAPNAVNNGTEVYSEVWDFDVRTNDANYTVEIVTGLTTPPYRGSYPSDDSSLFYPIAFVCMVFIVMLFLARKYYIKQK